MWTVFTLGQETSRGTIWPGCDLGVSRDSETWGYFSKEPPPFLPPPPPHPLKLPRNVFHVCCIHFTTSSWYLSLNSRLIAPESREVKLNLSKWEHAVWVRTSVMGQENPPHLLFKKLHVSYIILKRWEALSFQRTHLRLQIRRSQFYFKHGHWCALWIWINHVISLAPNLLLHKMRNSKYLTTGLESVLLKVKKQNLHRVSEMRKEGWPRNHQRSSTANIIDNPQGQPQKTRVDFRYSLAALPAS